MSASTGAAAPMSTGLVVLTLSVGLGIQPVTTDLYLPALPALTAGFGAPMGQAQYTLSALLLAFGVSQLVWGPLSDRYGRRPILLIGLAMYLLAAIGCALAPSMVQLIVWRALQGAAMGAVVMCARALVRDLYPPQDGARVMSKGMSGLGALACASPALGGVLTQFYGAQAALLAVAVFGALALAIVALTFKETLSLKNPHALLPHTLVHTLRGVVSNRTFLAFSALSITSYAGLFTFLACSPFVLIGVLGLTKLQFGWAMFVVAFAYLCGTFICRRLLLRLSVQQTVALAGGLSLLGGTLLGGLALAGVASVWAVIGPMVIFMVGHGVHQPCGQSGAVGPFPRAAGAASAMNGFFMMLAAFAMGSWLAWRLDGTVLPLANGVWFWSVLIAVSAWLPVRKYGQQPVAAA